MASATGVPTEQAKKRKGAPSTNEIFSTPVVEAKPPTVINGDRLQTGAKRVHLNPHAQVSIPVVLHARRCLAMARFGWRN
jgi:hypothetical protein